MQALPSTEATYSGLMCNSVRNSETVSERDYIIYVVYLSAVRLWVFSVVVFGLQNAGAVIGKGGSNIKRLRQDVSHCPFVTLFHGSLMLD